MGPCTSSRRRQGPALSPKHSLCTKAELCPLLWVLLTAAALPTPSPVCVVSLRQASGGSRTWRSGTLCGLGFAQGRAQMQASMEFKVKEGLWGSSEMAWLLHGQSSYSLTREERPRPSPEPELMYLLMAAVEGPGVGTERERLVSPRP